MATGTVKWFNGEKGFGFITPGEGGKDLFVHVSNLAGGPGTQLNEGDHVTFEVQEGRKGPEAVAVQVG